MLWAGGSISSSSQLQPGLLSQLGSPGRPCLCQALQDLFSGYSCEPWSWVPTCCGTKYRVKKDTPGAFKARKQLDMSVAMGMMLLSE